MDNNNIITPIVNIVDSKISLLLFDLTVLASIYNIFNIATGEYKVRYRDTIFSAYSLDTKKTYKVGDIVYVQIPGGDLSNKKIITMKVSGNTLDEEEITDLLNAIEPVSPSMDALYGLPIEDTSFGVIAGAGAAEPPDSEHSRNLIWSFEGDNAAFLQYSNLYNTIRIKAEFLTLLYSYYGSGNYGLKIIFTAQESQEVEYLFDISNFNGRPFEFNTYVPLELILLVEKGYLTGLKSITLFEDMPHYDKLLIRNGDGEYKDGEENSTRQNIFVRNIEIQWVEKKDLSGLEYYLLINTPKGIDFNGLDKNLTLQAKLINKGVNIINKASLLWYKRDVTVTVGNEEYNKNAGVAWKKIGKENAEIGEIQYETSPELVVNSIEAGARTQFKLVAIVDNTILTEEIELFNSVKTKFHIELDISEAEQDRFNILKLVNDSNDKELLGTWYVMYPDNTYLAVDNGESVNSILIDKYLLYPTVTFYCSVKEDESYLGTITHKLERVVEQADFIATFNGEDMYLYNANGDMRYEDTEVDRVLTVNITLKPGTIIPFKLEWLAPNGTVLNDLNITKSNPYNGHSLSMILNLFVDNKNYLHYNIKLKYYNNYNNNTVYARITTGSGEVYTFAKELLFLKDGDLGTNGTTYVIVARPCDEQGNKLSGFLPLTNKKPLKLKCFIYKNGEIYDNGDTTFDWSLHNVNLQEGSGDLKQQIINVVYANENIDTYAKVEALIPTEDGSLYISAFYPIDILIGNIEQENVDISAIPSYIKYGASGYNSSYYSNELTFTIGENTFNNIEGTYVTGTDKKYLNPPKTIIPAKNEDISPVTTLTLKDKSNKDIIYHPIIMFIDTYGNEAINGWDGLKLKIDDKGLYIFAPLIGAGTKSDSNLFTGVVMGKDKNKGWGLFGFSDGKGTFGLEAETGDAWFGFGKLISIDAEKATISGGTTDTSEANYGSMILRLKNTTKDNKIDKSTKAIEIINKELKVTEDSLGIVISQEWINTSPFYITYGGLLVATNVKISGEINATTLDTRNGYIGGWKITSNGIESSNGTVSLLTGGRDSDKARIKVGNIYLDNTDGLYILGKKFKVDLSGNVYANTFLVNTTDWLPSTNESTILAVTLGSVGMIEGLDGNNNKTINVGLKSIEGYGIRIESAKSIAMDAKEGIFLTANTANVNLETKGKDKILSLNAKLGKVDIDGKTVEITGTFSANTNIFIPNSTTEYAIKNGKPYAYFA